MLGSPLTLPQLTVGQFQVEKSILCLGVISLVRSDLNSPPAPSALQLRVGGSIEESL